MRILGIDPGTHRTGVGLIEPAGTSYRLIHTEVITADSKKPLHERLHFIFQALTALVRDHHPDVVALEGVFYAKDIRATVMIGEARACAILAASGAGIPVVEYAPARVKQAVSGNGRAGKDQVQYMIKNMLGLKEAPPADSADALAIAICHGHNAKKVEILNSKQTAKSKFQIAKKSFGI